MDLHNNIKVLRAISPVSGAGDDVASVSQIIDRANYDTLEFVIATGSLADANATFTALVEHGDDASLTDAAAVPDTELLGTEALASFQFDDDDETRKIGYRGSKRYVRLTLTPAGNTGAWLHSAVAILADARKLPLS